MEEDEEEVGVGASFAGAPVLDRGDCKGALGSLDIKCSPMTRSPGPWSPDKAWDPARAHKGAQ